MSQRFNPERLSGGKTLAGALALGAFLMALTVESTATAVDRRRYNKKPIIDNHEHEGGKAIYVLPGCRANGHVIGQLMEPHIQHIGTTHYEAYPDEGFSLEEVKESLLEARANDQEKPAIFYALSMGGMVLTSLLLDDDFRTKFGKIDRVIFDSSPSSAADLDKGTKLAMLAASILPASFTLSRIYRNIMRKNARKLFEPHSILISDEEVRQRRLSTANTPLTAVEAQTKFIESVHLEDGSGDKIANEIGAMYYISAKTDHIVENIEGAYEKYNRVFGGKVLRVIDLQRPDGCHADGPIFPEGVIELMQEPLPQRGESAEIPVIDEIPHLKPAMMFDLPLAA